MVHWSWGLVTSEIYGHIWDIWSHLRYMATSEIYGHIWDIWLSDKSSELWGLVTSEIYGHIWDIWPSDKSSELWGLVTSEIYGHIWDIWSHLRYMVTSEIYGQGTNPVSFGGWSHLRYMAEGQIQWALGAGHIWDIWPRDKSSEVQPTNTNYMNWIQLPFHGLLHGALISELHEHQLYQVR